MFKLAFDTPIILSLLYSIIFLIINLSLSNNLNNVFQKKKIFYNFKYSYLLSFYFIFLLDCLIFNLLILLEQKILSFYLYYLGKILIFIILFKKIEFNIKYTKIDFIYKFILSIFLIISFLPITDADSISIHLNFPLAYLYNQENIFDPIKYTELSLYFNSEIILLNSVLIKSSNLGNLLNFSTLVIFLYLSFEKLKKNNFLVFLFSMPLILFLLNTQKLQIFFAILYLVIFIYFYSLKIKKINNRTLLIISLLIIFYISGKLNYLLLSIPLIIFILMKIKIKSLIFLRYLVLSSIFLILPILLNKYYFYQDPVAPFLSNLLNTDLQYKNLLNTISKQGWRADDFKYADLFQFIVPANISYLSAATGFGFLYVLYKHLTQKIKPYFYVSISGILLIYFSGQIISRFYLESILLLFWYSNFKITKLINYFFKLQILIITIILSLFIFYSLTYILQNTNSFMKKYSYTYFNALNLNNLQTNKNILLLDTVRDSIFYKKNIYPLKVKNNDQYLIDTIRNYNIKYIVSNKYDKIPKCIKVELYKKIKTKNVTRNFFKAEKLEYKQIFLVKNNNC